MRRPARIVLAPFLLLLAAAPLAAQPLCRGDVDGDGFVTTADVEPLIDVLFDVDGFTAETALLADITQDGDVSAADVVGVLLLDGLQCPGGGGPTRTRTPTATATRTVPFGATPTPTPTPTRTPTGAATAEPTAVCAAAPLAAGVTSGALAASDCALRFSGETRFADEYSFTGIPGRAVRIDIAATGFVPWVRVIDGNGWFLTDDGPPPAEIRMTSDRPYTILVTSRPDTPGQVGSYQLTVSTRACATETLSTRIASIDGTECPDPGLPRLGEQVEYADVYTFNVAEPLTLVSITMRQSIEDSLVDPLLTVYGPGGFEVFPAFQADDLAGGGFGFDAAARFLALDTGTYTVVATTGGCDPADEFRCGYRIQYSATRCPATALGDIPATTRKAVAGVLYGDTLRTRCAALPPLPGGDDAEIPEVGSPADTYTFAGTAGEVITLEMESDDEAQLYLFGPAAAGTPLLGADGDSSGNQLAQIGMVLPFTGTYTVVAANKNFALAPDPEDPEDEGDSFVYTLFVQKCPVQGGIDATGLPRNDGFAALDCIASGDVPVRSYAVTLTAGTYAEATMTAAGFDAALTLVGPDGVRFSNDDDPLTPGARNARLGRLVPLTGTYFVEATAPAGETVPGGSAPFTLRLRTCATTPAAPGLVDGSLAEADCALDDGRRFDVVTFDAPPDAATNPSVAGILPGDGVCLWPVLPSPPAAGEQTCAAVPVEVPVARTGRHAWVIVGSAPATRGAYSLDFTRCAAGTLRFGSAVGGLLQGSACSDAAGRPSAWFALREPADAVRFAAVATGSLTTTFPASFTVAAPDGAAELPARFGVDVDRFFGVGSDLLAVLRLQGASSGAGGGYDIEIDIPDRRR